jgi:hypothetical protein
MEIQGMWKVKTRVILVIRRATGTVSKSFRRFLSNIPEKHAVKELQKIAILGTAHILRKVLMYKYRTFIIGYTVCPQSPIGVLKNCGAQTN